MSFEGNSGPYIQYAYVRAIRILEKEDYKTGQTQGTAPTENSRGESCVHPDASFNSDSEIDLAKKIMNFKVILKEATILNYPHIIT
jgi:arginyl-tRNA synthetase